MSKDQFLRLGKVGKAQGLKGHFYVSDRSEPLPDLKEIFLGLSDQDRQGFKVKSQSWNGERNILSVTGIDDRTAAESFLHKEIWMPRADLQLNNNEILWVDLEGLPVIASDETPMGFVRIIANYGASDIVEIVKDGKLLSLPLTSDYFDLSFFNRAHSVKSDSLNDPLTGIPVNITLETKLNIEALRLNQDATFFSEYWEDDKDA